MNTITQNTKITSTDINTLIEECNNKLSLSGGKLTGRLTGVYYDQLCAGLDHTVLPSTTAFGTSIRFLDKNSTPFASLGPIKRSTGENILRLSVFKADGVNGTHLDIQQKDGEAASMLLAGSRVLTETGGTLTGELYTPGYGCITSENTTEQKSLALFGCSSKRETSASINLKSIEDPDEAGVFYINAKDDTNGNKSLIGKPSGSLTWNGNDVITSAGGTFKGNVYSLKFLMLDIIFLIS